MAPYKPTIHSNSVGCMGWDRYCWLLESAISYLWRDGECIACYRRPPNHQIREGSNPQDASNKSYVEKLFACKK